MLSSTKMDPTTTTAEDNYPSPPASECNCSEVDWDQFLPDADEDTDTYDPDDDMDSLS